MITYSIIKKSQLEEALRLDAEYYQPEYLEIKKLFNKRQYLVLGEHAFVTDGEHGSVELQSEGVKYLTAENIGEGFLKLDGVRYVSKDVDTRNKRASLVVNDVVLSIKGNVGDAAIVFKDNLPANMNRDVARIHIKDTINPFFLTSFFNSKFGQGQTLRESSGNVQQMITLARIRELLIPKISDLLQKDIEKVYMEARHLFDQSSQIYSQVEDLLLGELGLKGFENEESLFSIVNLSEVKKSSRMDADYFQSQYGELLSQLKNKTKTVKLGNIATLKRGSLINPKYYSETEGVPYIRGGDFSSGRLEKQGVIYIKDFQNKEETRVRDGDIVFTLIGSVGASALVEQNFDNSFISNNTGKIAINNKKETLPEYLYIILQSIIGKYQFEKEVSRTAQPKISDSQVATFSIPILPKEIQQKIADLVKKSHQARKEAKELLEEAKQKVEKLIEN